MDDSSLKDACLPFSVKTIGFVGEVGKTWSSVGRRPSWQVMRTEKLMHILMTP